jgi:hypothetical protein
MPFMTILANAVLFQLGWFAAVLGAAGDLPWLGVLAAAAIAAVHLARAARPLPELALLALAVVAGAGFDTLIVQAGWLRFDSGVLVAGTAPVWMVALWANFATTLNVSMRVLRSRLLVAALFGALGAPAAYYAGGKLGAVEFIATGPALGAIAAGWFVLCPLLFAAARRLDGYALR